MVAVSRSARGDECQRTLSSHGVALSLRSWLAEDCMTWGRLRHLLRRLMPAEAARADISRRHFYGGG